MGSRFPITTASKVFFAGAALLLLGACATAPVEPETGGRGQKVSSAQVLSICEKLAKSKDTRLAIGLCEKAHLEDQQNPVPLLLLGDMLQQQGALGQAGRAYGMAIDLDPENVEAHYGLGKVFLARNQFDLAIEQFEVARELNTRDHRLYNALGVVLDNLGDHIAAQAHYKIGLELAPNNHALQKNLMLSRRLDSSVTTPAIGPRHKVVPRPASPQAVPDAAPEAAPSQPAPNSPGRLGHEPLAQVPAAIAVPAEKSFAAAAPAPTAVPVEFSATEPASVIQTPGTAVKPAPDAAESGETETPAQTAVATAQPRFIPLPPRAKPQVPANSYLNAVARAQVKEDQPRAIRTEPAPLPARQALVSAYDEIPLPNAAPAAAPRLSPRAEQGPAILASGFDSHHVVAEALPALQPAPQAGQMAELLRGSSTQAAATQPEPEDATAVVGVASIEPVTVIETLAASSEAAPLTAEAAANETGTDAHVAVLAEAVADTEPSASAETTDLVSASLSSDSMSSDASEDHFASETSSDRLKDAIDPRPAASAAPSVVPTEPVTVTAVETTSVSHAPVIISADATSAGVSHSHALAGSLEAPAPLSLVSNSLLQTASLTSGEAEIQNGRSGQVEPTVTAVVPADSYQRSAKPHRRFGREHEEDHETRHVEGEFWDLVDVVNPMQHIPVVATIYRDVTDDEIKPAAKIAGGTLFGGVLGFASSLVDSMFEEASGQDIGETALAAVSQPDPEPADEAVLALNQHHEELRLAHARGR